MPNTKFEVNYRAQMTKGRANELRRQGWATGSVFGHGAEPIPVEIDLHELVERVKEAPSGLKSLFDLKVKGGPKGSDGTVIVKGFTKDPVSRKTLDVQFQRVAMKEKVHIGVPIMLVGNSVGASKGGIIEQSLDELQVRCLPHHIPAKIDLDIAELDVGHHISVLDLALGPDIEVLSDPEAIVVACVAHRIPGG